MYETKDASKIEHNERTVLPSSKRNPLIDSQMKGNGISQNKTWEDPFDVAHGVMAPSYSSPTPDIFFSATTATTPWKYWGFETGSVQTGWEWGDYQAASPDRLQATQNKRAECDQSVSFTVKHGDIASGGA